MARDMVCKEAVEVATDYLEGRLGRRDRTRYEAHLAACPHCSRYLKQLRAVIAAAREPTPEDLTDDAREGLLSVFEAWKASG